MIQIACKHIQALLGKSKLLVSIIVEPRSFDMMIDDKEDREGCGDYLCALHTSTL